jgi:hypothetical protein
MSRRYPRRQTLLPFELELARAEWQAEDARDAAAFAALQAKIARQKQRKHEKEARRVRAAIRKRVAAERRAEREAKTAAWRRKTAADYKYRHEPVAYARCGMHSYIITQKEKDTGCYWRACHRCGQPLIFTRDPNAEPQQCKGDKSWMHNS